MNGRLGMTGNSVVRGDSAVYKASTKKAVGKSFIPGKGGGYRSATQVPIEALRAAAAPKSNGPGVTVSARQSYLRGTKSNRGSMLKHEANRKQKRQQTRIDRGKKVSPLNHWAQSFETRTRPEDYSRWTGKDEYRSQVSGQMMSGVKGRSTNAWRVYKADAKRDYSGTAVGTGTVIGATGLIGGGVPGARPNSGRLAQAKRGGKFEATRHLVSATRGGVFGYRADAHQRFLNTQNADELAHGGKKTTRANHYLRGKGSGKVAPEKQIIEHMRAGRVGSNYALAGGAVLAGMGVNQRKKTLATGKVTKRDNYKNDAVIAGGTTTAIGAGGGSLVLDHQGRKWAKRSAASLDESNKINPKLGGYDVKRTKTRVPDVAPHRSQMRSAADRKKVFAGRSSKNTEAAGALRGAAGQQRYFAGVYGSVARRLRQVGAAGVLAGTAGLGARQWKHHNEVEKKYIPRVLRPKDSVGPKRLIEQHTAAMWEAQNIGQPGLAQAHQAFIRDLKAMPGVRGKLVRVNHQHVTKAETTMSDSEAKRLSGKYDTRGPLPKGLDRATKMKAYEARYIASGGKQGEKWKRRADHAEVGRNIGLSGATASGAALLVSRGRTGAKLVAKVPKLTPHKIEGAALTSGVGGGAAELYGEHARHRRASYANSPAGIAGSALTRMRAYTPGGAKT